MDSEKAKQQRTWDEEMQNERIIREEYAETHTQERRKPRLSRDLARWHGEAVKRRRRVQNLVIEQRPL